MELMDADIFLDAEEIVAKVQHVQDCETFSPFEPLGNAGATFYERIEHAQRALSLLDPSPRHQRGALALFANVIYLGRPILNDAWRFLYRRLSDYITLPPDEILRASAMFELDNQLLGEFVAANNIRERLDTDVFPRIHSVRELVMSLESLLASPDKSLLETLHQVFIRRYWILLTDLSLSGTSVTSCLERLHQLATLGRDVCPLPVLLCQVQTIDSQRTVRGSENLRRVPVIRALYLDERYKVGHSECVLFSDAVHEEVKGCCQMFHERVVKKDPDFAATLSLSDNDMTYGFKQGGWTVVTSHNAPENGPPLIWYPEGRSRDLFSYIGPLPRRRSRIKQRRGDEGERVARIMEQSDRIRKVLW